MGCNRRQTRERIAEAGLHPFLERGFEERIRERLAEYTAAEAGRAGSAP